MLSNPNISYYSLFSINNLNEKSKMSYMLPAKNSHNTE